MAVKFLNGIDVDGSMNIAASDVPNLDASKITSGTFSADRIPNLSGVYQPAGDYLTLETAETSFQPIGNYLTTTGKAADSNLLDGINSTQFVRSDTNSVTIGRHLDANTTWTNSALTLFLGWYGGKLVIGNNNDGGHDYASALGGNTIPILNNTYFWKTAKFEEDVQTDGKLNVLARTGTWITSNVMADSIGWNVNHGVYIGSNVGGTHYLRANGKFTTGGSTYDLWHEGNFNPTDKASTESVAAVNERIDTEVFDAINSKQPAGNYFTDGDTVLNMANNDGLVFNDTNNLMYVKADGNNYAIIDSRGGTVTGSINMTGGGTKLSMNNGDIVGVNQLKINDPGEGIVWNNGSSGDITLAVVDDASDNRLNLAGTNASLSVNNAVVATQSWVSGQGYLTSIPSTYATESYVNTAVSNLVDSAPGALNTLNELAAALGDDANFSTTVTNNIAAVDARINEEVIPYVDAVAADAAKGVTAYGWGNHASAGYLTSLPNNAATFTNNIYLSNSATTANFITELTNLGAFQDNYKAFKVAWSYAGNSNLDVGFESVELAGCLIECWGGTYKHVRLTRPTTGTGGRSIYVYNDQGSSYAPGWRQIWTSDEFSNTNLSNWDTAYGWGNHASAGYLKSIPSDYVRQGQDIVSGNIQPVGDRQQLLGGEENRWKIVFCEILDSAGQHEKNLQNPAGEKSVADYPTGTVMVWENGKNVPCTTYANHMRMGIAVENVDSPMIQGAEPVLVTGAVAEGDYLVTSTTEGHAVAVSRDTVKEEQLWDCVIGKALEGGEGESHLIKTWVTI